MIGTRNEITLKYFTFVKSKYDEVNIVTTQRAKNSANGIRYLAWTKIYLFTYVSTLALGFNSFPSSRHW